MNIEKICSLAVTPRSITPELSKVCGKPFFFLRKGVRQWEDHMQHGTVALAAVVQANSCLYDAEESQWAPAVLVYSPDPRTALDGGWINDLAKRVRYAPDMAALLANEDSDIDGPVSPALTGGILAIYSTQYISPARLPGRCIPEHGLLPVLATRDHSSCDLIPPDMYS